MINSIIIVANIIVQIQHYNQSDQRLKIFNLKGNLETARQLIELGINTKTQVMSEEEFNQKKAKIMNLRNQKETYKIKEIDCKKIKDPKIFENEPFLAALADREEAIVNGKKLSILFLR